MAIERVPEEFRWSTDGCPVCGAEHYQQGCAAVLPVALMASAGETLVFAYRCRHGHDWTTGYERSFARAHAEASRDELTPKDGPPYWPPAGEQQGFTLPIIQRDQGER